MKIITLPVSDLHPADYNPRKDLAPGDKQYEKLARSIETFGYVEPIVWNRTTGNIVGGHQRLKVLLDGLGDAAPETGFDLYEIEALENNVDALVDGDFLDSELKSIEETFNISLKFSAEDRDVLKEYIKDNGKEDLVAVIVQKIRGEI